jgi:glycosyltransferase involved in cell wall biosynthesis
LGAAGIGAAALSQIQSLARRGCDVRVYCWSTQESIPGVRIFETRRWLPAPQRLLGRERACRLHDAITAGLLKRAKTPPDVVHTWPLAAAKTLAAARSRRALAVREAPNTHTGHAFEVVAREHSRLSVRQPPGNPHRFSARVLAREVLEYDLADLILAPSELAMETFVRRGVAPEKVALKSYGFEPARYAAAARCGTRAAGPTFAFVGSCEPRKGLHLALDAWTRSGVADRTAFTVTGRYIPGYREILGPWLSHRHVCERGFVDDLRAVYKAADVLVLPSIEEGSALVTYEAQASGCALLVSDAAGARFTDGVEGLRHHAGDVEALAGHMRQLADDPARLSRMQHAAAANAQQYTWDRATDALLATYEAALAGRSSP